MVVFKAVMDYAASKRYIPADHRFGELPKFRKNRRDEFTLEEYRRLHTKGRAWIKKTGKSFSTEQRTVVYNFILIMCSTGMRPPEARNLRWRDITTAVDREQRKLIVLHVRGKDKERKLVAPEKIGEYLERVKALSKATAPSDPVFTNRDGSQAESLYQALIDDLLDYAGVRIGPSGAPRSTYSFRHTYATFRLSEGVDAYLLAEQMGTSVQMIQQHYGHVNTIKHANLVLHGMANWEPVAASDHAGRTELKTCPCRRSPSQRRHRNQKGARAQPRLLSSLTEGRHFGIEHRCSDPQPGARPFRRAVALLAGTDDKQPADQAAPSSVRPVGCVLRPMAAGHLMGRSVSQLCYASRFADPSANGKV